MGQDDYPLVSVIMTTLNSARFIAEAVDSILAQTFQYWELIIVDGGSTDGTIDILCKYNDSRIRLFLCSGLRRSAQLNYAMQKAQGEYLTIMDSDDIALPTRLDIEYQYLQSNADVTIVGSWGRSVDEKGKVLGLLKTPLNHTAILENLMTPMLIMFPSVMFRKQLCLIEFDVQIKKNVDIEWYLRISAIANFAIIPIPLIKIRETKGSLSRKENLENNKLLMDSIERTCGSRIERANNENELYLLNLWQGIIHYYYGSQKKAKHFLAISKNIRPTRFIVWRYYLPVLLPEMLFHTLRKNIVAYSIMRYIRSIQLVLSKNTRY